MEKFYPNPLNVSFIHGPVVIFVISLMICHLNYLYAQDSKKEFLQRFVVGEYVLIGKKINSDDTYFGAAIIKLQGEDLVMVRKIGENILTAKGEIIFSRMDSIPFFKFTLRQKEIEVEGAYMIHSDADNYARLTGYLYFPDKKTQSPGLEALFHKEPYDINKNRNKND